MNSSSRLSRGSTDLHKTAKRWATEQQKIRSTRYRKPEGKSSIAQPVTRPKGPPSPAQRVSNPVKLKDGKSKLHKPSNESSRPVKTRPGSKQSKTENPSPQWIDHVAKAQQSQNLRQLKPKNLNFYKVTDPPTTPQLDHASRFFNKHAPTLLASFPEFRLFPDTATPEVCFLGRSNVGKSSLINALFRGHKSEVFAHVSKKAGRTTTMNAFAVGPSVVGLKTHGVNKAGQVVRWEAAPKQWAGKGGLVLIDLQGYGLNSREKWGQEIMKLLTKRKQLRRAFVLIDAKDGLKDNDIDLLSLLRNNGVPHQIVFTKADRVLFSYGEKEPGAPLELMKHIKKIKDSQQRIWELLTDRSKWETSGLSALCDILVTIADKDIAAGWRLGIDPLRFAILQAAGLDCDREGRKITAAALAPVVTEDAEEHL